MKKSLLYSAALLLAATTASAAVPEGNLYLLGLNGQTAEDASNCLILGERTDDDIDEGIWRWSLPAVEVTETTGTISIAGPDGFTLGFDEDNEFGFTNNLSNTQGMMYLAVGGPAVNYNLKAGEYSVLLAVFEDLDGESGGDTWMLQLKSMSADDDENFYLIGFNGVETPSATSRFVRQVTEEDGETSTSYRLPKYYVGECPDGFTVLDSGNAVSYGMSEAFSSIYPEVTDENPMAVLAADGPAVACTLDPGYYDITFLPNGAMNMIMFMPSSDQTPDNKLEYYLIGLNGISSADDANKFIRSEEHFEYEDEESGELVSEDVISYSLIAEVKEACSLTVVSADGNVVYGYNSDMKDYMPNAMSGEMGFVMLATNGEAVNCDLTPGKYTFTFSLTGVGSGLLSAMPADDGAVGEISVEDALPVYYDLQGRRIQNPAKGIYIEKRGSKVAKVIL